MGNLDRSINTWGESSYPRRNLATPEEAIVAVSSARPRATYVDGYANYTPQHQESPQGDELGGQTITARGISSAFAYLDNCDNATDPDGNADGKMDPKLPNSGYIQSSHGFRETTDRYGQRKASGKSDAGLRIDLGK